MTMANKQPAAPRKQATMELTSGADVVVQALVNHGVEVVFAYPGGASIPLHQALTRFRPATFGQASRLEGITPADLTLLAVLVKKRASPKKPWKGRGKKK